VQSRPASVVIHTVAKTTTNQAVPRSSGRRRGARTGLKPSHAASWLARGGCGRPGWIPGYASDAGGGALARGVSGICSSRASR